MRTALISLELAVEGTVDRRDGQMRFSEIVLRPHLQVPAGTQPERPLPAMPSRTA